MTAMQLMRELSEIIQAHGDLPVEVEVNSEGAVVTDVFVDIDNKIIVQGEY